MLPGQQRIVVDLPTRTIVRVVAVVLLTVAAVDVLAHVARILI